MTLTNDEARLEAVAQLHRLSTRWTNTATEEYESYHTREEAVQAYLDSRDEEDDDKDRPVPPSEIDSFDLCAECSRIERESWVEQGGDDWAYLSSTWPCRTAVALGVALPPRVS